MTIAQRVEALHRAPQIAAWWQQIDTGLEALLHEAIRVQQIPAPTFHEQARAEYVRTQWQALKLADITVDDHANAYGRLPGTDPAAPALLLSAHTDTVFGPDTDLTVRHADDETIYGPGLGDNSLGVAGLITLGRLLRHFDIQPRRDIWLLANSREEGLGNLDGIRAFYERHGSQIGQAIVIEGMAFGYIYHVGIGVRRLRITCRAPGGHSWYGYEQPSAIHDLVRLGARLTTMQPPAKPRTTYNIGLIEGGNSINSLAAEASLSLDLRSEDPAALEKLVADVLGHVEAVKRDYAAQIEVATIGERPSGSIPLEHELVQGAAAALRAVGETPQYERGSTDGNHLLAAGVPAVTVGLTYGGQAHRLDEFITTSALAAGMRHLCLLALAAAE